MMHRFDPRKALEVAVYLSGRIGEYHEFVGTLYLANKLHLLRHGRSIVSDTYTSSTLQGAQMTATLIEASEPGDADAEPPAILRSDQDIRRSILVPAREADLKFLSKSDVECLDNAVEIVSVLSHGAVREMLKWEADALLDAAHDKLEASGDKMSIGKLVRGVGGLDDMDVARTMNRKPEGLVEYIGGGD